MVQTIIGILFFSTFLVSMFSSVMTVFTPHKIRPVMEGLAGVSVVVMLLLLAAAVAASLII